MDLRACEPREKRGPDADRSGARDQHPVAGGQSRTGHRMGPDRQEFDHGRLDFVESFGGYQVACRNCNALAEAAVAMNAQHRDVRAAIRFAAQAGSAFATGDIGIDHDKGAGLDAAYRA